MVFVRITRALPTETGRREAMHVIRQLVALYMSEPGCLFQGTTENGDHREIVKISLWEDKRAADAAAGQPLSLALRSELLSHCREKPHEEAYEVWGGFRKSALASQRPAA